MVIVNAWHTIRLGEHLKLSEEQLIALRRAGVVHDVGKIAVPDAILLKPVRLTAEEWTLIKEHPVVGERICAPLKSFRFVLPIIRYHHEKFDGSGYPDGLRGEAIPVTARGLQFSMFMMRSLPTGLIRRRFRSRMRFKQ